jgi:hypothetical protein
MDVDELSSSQHDQKLRAYVLLPQFQGRKETDLGVRVVLLPNHSQNDGKPLLVDVYSAV